MPNVLIEAGISGIPVIASDIAEIKYVAPSKGWTLCKVDEPKDFAMAIVNTLENLSYFEILANQNTNQFL